MKVSSIQKYKHENTQAVCLVSGKHLEINPPSVIFDPEKNWDDHLKTIKKMMNIEDISIIFSTFTDGRGYSLAAKLKERRMVKCIHATGKITEELSYYLKRSGFDVAHFPMRKNSIGYEENTSEANKLINPFSNHYQVGNEKNLEKSK